MPGCVLKVPRRAQLRLDFPPARAFSPTRFFWRPGMPGAQSEGLRGVFLAGENTRICTGINARVTLPEMADHFMKLTLEIEEDKIPFFLELIRNFNFVRVDAADKALLNREHLLILEERLAAYEADPENVVSWEEVQAAAAKRLR